MRSGGIPRRRDTLQRPARCQAHRRGIQQMSAATSCSSQGSETREDGGSGPGPGLGVTGHRCDGCLQAAAVRPWDCCSCVGSSSAGRGFGARSSLRARSIPATCAHISANAARPGCVSLNPTPGFVSLDPSPRPHSNNWQKPPAQPPPTPPAPSLPPNLLPRCPRLMPRSKARNALRQP